MEHVVFYPVGDAPAFRRFGDLDEAVRFVEHLRNEEGVADVSVHALTEVPLSFKAWYRVEVPGPAPAAEPSVDVVPDVIPDVIPDDVAVFTPSVEEPVNEPVVAVNGSGERGLGYFSD